MKNKKKVLALALILAMALAAVAGTTLAYFTDKDEATNTFTVGNVDIELKEEKWVEPETVEPGIEYAKDPTVYNVGKNDAWIRINVTLSDYAAFAAAAEKHNVTDLATVFGGFDDSKWTLAGTPVVDTTNDTVTYSYYYNTILEVGDSSNTGALFTSVTVPKSFDSTDMESLGEDFTITVTADAIQANGLDTVEKAFEAFDAE